MKRFFLILILSGVLLSVSIDALAQSSIGGRSLGDNLEEFSTVTDWWFQNAYLNPRNARKLREAVDAEKMRMKPGEIKRFRVIVSGEGDSAVFQYLDPVSSGMFLPNGARVDKTIVIAKSRSGRAALLPETPTIRSNESFEFWRKHFPRGVVDRRDFETVAKGISDMCGKGAFSESNKKFFAPVTGTVILLAHGNSDYYEVYNVDTMSKDPKPYKQGNALSELGTTVWILSSDGRYVVVFSKIEFKSVEVGQTVLSGKTEIGYWKQDFDIASLQIYRIFNPDQRFLRDVGEPKPIPLLKVKD